MAGTDLTYVIRADDAPARAAIKRVIGESMRWGAKGIGIVGASAASAIGNTISRAITSQVSAAIDGSKRMLQEGFGQLKLGIIDNASLEDATVTMTQLTKSAKVAGEMISALRKEADKSPFDTGEMIEAGKSLTSYAKGSTKELMKLVGVAEMLAALKPEQGLEGAAVALKNALGGEFVSLIDRFDLDRSVVKRLKDEGKRGAEVVTAALAEMGVTMDLIRAKGETFTGRLSTITAFGVEIRRRLTEGLFGWLSQKLGSIGGMIEREGPGILEKVSALGRQIGEQVGSAIDASMKVVLGAWQTGNLGNLFTDFISAARPLIELI